MPPFTTLNGQTGYFDNNGQFVPASQEQYNQQFGMLQQFGGNPFLNAAQQSPLNNQRTNFVQQGSIQSPETAAMTNEQKVSVAQGDNVPMLGNMPYVQKGNELGVQKGKSFFPYNAETASGHPLNTATKTVFNAYDLMTNRKNDIVNPYAAQDDLMRSQNAASFLNNLSNKPTATAAQTQTQITVPQTTGATEIIPTSTTEQAGGGNWLSNMFNKPSVEGVPAVENVVDNGLKSDVLGDWGKMGFDAKKAFTGTTGTSVLGAGIGAATKLIGANASNYDQRVGMSKPNALGTMLGDSTFTQMGSSFGPAGMAIGGTIDLIKNAVKYVKQKDKYENKKLAVDTMQSIDDARENMKPDYTGYARSGTQVNNPYIKNYQNGGEAWTGVYDLLFPKTIEFSKEVQDIYDSFVTYKNQNKPVGYGTVLKPEEPKPKSKAAKYRAEQLTNSDDYKNWEKRENENKEIENRLNNALIMDRFINEPLGEGTFPYQKRNLGHGLGGHNLWESLHLGAGEFNKNPQDNTANPYAWLAGGTGEDGIPNMVDENDPQSIYFIKKDLSQQKEYPRDARIMYDNYKYDDFINERDYINQKILPKGYNYQPLGSDNFVHRNFTPEKDTLLGGIYIDPKTLRYLAEKHKYNDIELKKAIMRYAKINEDRITNDLNNVYIHTNTISPNMYETYRQMKANNINSIFGWNEMYTDEKGGREGEGGARAPYYPKYPKNANGGMAQNPYLK